MTVRMLRSTVLGEMNKAYVRTAIARGNDRRQVLWGHVLKNSLVSTVTFLGQTMAEIVAGSIVVEQVFSIPGLGRMLVASIANRDYPVVQAIVVILAFWVVLSGTIADLICRRIDPRQGGGTCAMKQAKGSNPYLTLGLLLSVSLLALIVLGMFWTPYDPNAMAAGAKLDAPSLAHLMGTDSFGRDIFSRVLKGAGTTFRVALCTVAHRRRVRHFAGGGHRDISAAWPTIF